MPFTLMPISSFAIDPIENPPTTVPPLAGSEVIEHDAAGCMPVELEVTIFPFNDKQVPGIAPGFVGEVLLRKTHDAKGVALPGSSNPWTSLASQLPSLITSTPGNNQSINSFSIFVPLVNHSSYHHHTCLVKVSFFDGSGLNIAMTSNKRIYFA